MLTRPAATRLSFTRRACTRALRRGFAAHAATSPTAADDDAKVAAFRSSIKLFDPHVYKNKGIQVFKGCAMYTQKAGIIDDAGELLRPQGSTCAVVTGDFMENKYGARLDGALAKGGIKATKVLMGPEASWNEIYNVYHAVKAKNVDFLLGMGGGKVMDVTRITAFLLNKPHSFVPTLASTDAPGTAAAVVYRTNGTFHEFVQLPTCPDAVLMDTQIIAESPLRFTIAGLGDAMSTYYEARAVRKSGGTNLAGGYPCVASWALVSALREVLLEVAPKAMEDLRAQKITPAVEKIIEANSLLSGVGANASGIACAHALHNGLTSLPEVHDHRMHGEIVGWTTVVQLLMEGDKEEARRIAEWNKTVGLPCTFEDMKMTGIEEERVMKAVELACVPHESMHQMPFPVKPEMVYDAMKQADALGRTL